MKSKTSFFNPKLFCKALTRWWPVWILECGVWLWIVVMPVFVKLSTMRQRGMGFYHEIDSDELWRWYLLSSGMSEGGGKYLTDALLLAGLCLLTVVSLFSYLTNSREAYQLHSFPMRRETLFISHYLAGLVMLVSPVFLGYLALLSANGIYGLHAGWALMGKLMISVIEILFFYHLGLMIVMLTGNMVMAAVLYGVVNVLYVAICSFFSSLADIFVYGHSGYSDFMDPLAMWLSPVMELSSEFMFNNRAWHLSHRGVQTVDALWNGIGWKDSLWFLLPIVIFFLVAVFLYRRRSIEAAGDMMAFSWGRPIFRLMLTLCGSAAFARMLYIVCIQDRDFGYTYPQLFPIVLILTGIGSVLCYLISNMCLERSFFIWRKTSYLRMGLLTLGILGIVGYMKWNENRNTLTSDQIEMLSLSCSYADAGDGSESSDGSAGEVWSTYYFCGKEQIEEMLALEQKILQWGKETVRDEVSPSMLEMTYTLKGGGEVTRSCRIPYETKEYQDVLDFLYVKQDIRQEVFTPEYDRLGLGEVQFWCYGNENEEPKELEQQEQKERLYQAVLADLREGNIIYGQEMSEESVLYLGLQITLPKDQKKKYPGCYWEQMDGSYIYFDLTKEASHTLAAWNEMAEEKYQISLKD